jgi:hypothetical protein
MPWKKIASLFAVSLSLGILGASCAAKDEEPSDTSDVAEDCEALQAADSAVAPTDAPVERFDRERERREHERCHRRCEERFFDCIRGFDRDRERRFRCERRRQECFFECRRRFRF